MGFECVLGTVLYLYTYLVVQGNTLILIEYQHVLPALVNNGNSDRLYFLGSKITGMVIAAMKLKDACSLEEKL